MTKRGISIDIPEGETTNIDKYINRLQNQVAKNGIPGKLKEKRSYISRGKKKKAKVAQAKREQRKKNN